MSPTPAPAASAPEASPDRRNDPRERAERNKRFVLAHFDDFVNRKDLGALDRNMASDYYDHDGPEDAPAGRERDRAMMAALFRRLPDLRVTVLSAVAEGDTVMVRNQWVGTDTDSGERMEFHGFVEWRFADGQIVERWATVTAPRALGAAAATW